MKKNTFNIGGCEKLKKMSVLTIIADQKVKIIKKT